MKSSVESKKHEELLGKCPKCDKMDLFVRARYGNPEDNEPPIINCFICKACNHRWEKNDYV